MLERKLKNLIRTGSAVIATGGQALVPRELRIRPMLLYCISYNWVVGTYPVGYPDLMENANMFFRQ